MSFATTDERVLFHLAKSSFLSIWSFSSLYTVIKEMPIEVVMEKSCVILLQYLGVTFYYLATSGSYIERILMKVLLGNDGIKQQ